MTPEELIKRYKNGERNFWGADLGRADLREADLREAYLLGADLRGADLRGADLRGAYLRGADLGRADLREADLREAYLRGADLGGANLLGAYLLGAYLRGAYLWGADLRGAYLPSPTVVLLANWGNVSDNLCTELMRYDATCHPNPMAFWDWSHNDGPCPYDGLKIQRACNFKEKKHLFSGGQTLGPFELMVRLIREKCKDSDYHDK